MKTKRTKTCVVEALFRTSFCTKTSTRFCTECGLALTGNHTCTTERTTKVVNIAKSCPFKARRTAPPRADPLSESAIKAGPPLI